MEEVLKDRLGNEIITAAPTMMATIKNDHGIAVVNKEYRNYSCYAEDKMILTHKDWEEIGNRMGWMAGGVK